MKSLQSAEVRKLKQHLSQEDRFDVSWFNQEPLQNFDYPLENTTPFDQWLTLPL